MRVAGACVQALRTGLLHPNPNLFEVDPAAGKEAAGVLVGRSQEAAPGLRVALSNSFGFGGHHSCIAFGKYEGGA